MVRDNRYRTRKRTIPDPNRSKRVDTVRQRNWIAAGRRPDGTRVQPCTASSAALVGEASQAVFDLELKLPTQVII